VRATGGLRRHVLTHAPFSKLAKTAFVHAPIASTPPIEVGGVATLQGFAAVDPIFFAPFPSLLTTTAFGRSRGR